jgi:hypothetical protein
MGGRGQIAEKGEVPLHSKPMLPSHFNEYIKIQQPQVMTEKTRCQEKNGQYQPTSGRSDIRK